MKMAHCSLDSESPTKPCKSRGSNLHFHFKDICETAQTIRGMHIYNVTKYPTVVFQRISVCQQYNGRGIGMPRLNSKAGNCISGPQNSAQFFLHTLKNAESDAELKI